MCVVVGFEISSYPLEDLSVTTTGVEIVLIISSADTVRQGRVGASANALLFLVPFVLGFEIPVNRMASAYSNHGGRSFFLRESDIIDSVSVSILAEKLVTRHRVVYVHTMAVRLIDSREILATRRDG